MSGATEAAGRAGSAQAGCGRARFPRRRSTRVFVAMLLLLLIVPYAESRILSRSRQISVVQMATGQPPQRPTDTMRIGCYNIAHGRGLAKSNWQGGSQQERIDRLQEIAALLRQMDAEVMVLNEVDFDSSWSGGIDQATYLADLAGFDHVAECRSIDVRFLHWTWRHGVAVLSKYPITHAQCVDFPAYSRLESLLAGKKRGLVCRVDMPHGVVRVAAVHLSHRDESIRLGSARMLDQLAQDKSAPAIVLAGDFNSTPSGFPGFTSTSAGGNAIDVIDAGRRFRRLPRDRPVQADMTYSSDDPNQVIDWILIPRRWAFDHYTVPASKLSDHRPLIAEVTIIGASQL